MIETPSAMVSDLLADEADFFQHRYQRFDTVYACGAKYE